MTLSWWIRTYKATSLFDQKLSAGEGRTAVHDLYDLAFLASEYGYKFSDEPIRRAEQFTPDYDLLASEYDHAFRIDKVLSELSTAEDRALMFRIAIEEQLARRDEALIEQAAPADRSLPKVLALHNMWLETEGREGRIADLSGTNLTGAVLYGVNFEKAVLVRADFTDADLRHANLRGAIVRKAVFDGTNLQGADVTGADLTGITMQRTRLGPSTKGIGEALVKATKRQGWLGYYGRCDTPSVLARLEGWTRRRLRSAIWKQWTRGRRRYAELRRRDVNAGLAARTADSAHGPWRLANSPALGYALTNAYFASLGLPRLQVRK